MYSVVYSVQCTVYSVQCKVYSVQCTVYSVRCTVYSVQCTVYGVQCTVYSVQCTEQTGSGYGTLNRTRHMYILEGSFIRQGIAQPTVRLLAKMTAAD